MSFDEESDPLDYYVTRGSLRKVSLLLAERNADGSYKYNFTHNPLMSIMRSTNSAEMVQLILDNMFDGDTLRISHVQITYCATCAFEEGASEIFQKLITFTNPGGEYMCNISDVFDNILSYIELGAEHASMLEMAIDAREDLFFDPGCVFLEQCATSADMTRVIINARDGENEFRFDISEMLSVDADIEAFKLLMNARNPDRTHRCDVARDDCSILKEACMNGHVDIAKLCVEAKTDAGDYMCNLDIDDGEPLIYALDFAYEHKKESEEIVKTLLDACDARGEYRCSINRTHIFTAMAIYDSMLKLLLSYRNRDGSPRFSFNNETYVNRALRFLKPSFLSAILPERNADGSLYVNLSVPQQHMLLRKAIHGRKRKLLELALTLKHNGRFQIAEPPNLLMLSINAENASILRVVLESRFNSKDRIGDMLDCDVWRSRRSCPLYKGQLFYHICKLSSNLAEFVVNGLAAYSMVRSNFLHWKIQETVLHYHVRKTLGIPDVAKTIMSQYLGVVTITKNRTKMSHVGVCGNQLGENMTREMFVRLDPETQSLCRLLASLERGAPVASNMSPETTERIFRDRYFNETREMYDAAQDIVRGMIRRMNKKYTDTLRAIGVIETESKGSDEATEDIDMETSRVPALKRSMLRASRKTPKKPRRPASEMSQGYAISNGITFFSNGIEWLPV